MLPNSEPVIIRSTPQAPDEIEICERLGMRVNKEDSC